ncbi:MAG: MBL fold metallo-hydrolase [Clostridia bacterium]|nr:MBL fold metallo-hydrolase [Clostridia bacterium]
MYKRKFLALIAITVITVFVFTSCKSPNLTERNYRENDGGFSVHYLDVGQGDCALIHFPDGKTMMIDVGNGERENNQYVLGFLENFSVSKIDYLVLTHPDADHIGGAKELALNVQINNAYIPHILDLNGFANFKTTVDVLENKNVSLKISATYERIKGQDYVVAFLTPYEPNHSSSSYDNINVEYPTESDINNVSPIIYIEYKGIRFLFTGDAGSSQENLLLEDEQIITQLFEILGVTVNLDNIDFLKVAHHGSADSTTENFIKRLTPKNAVISVGGLNSFGHPSSQVLYRLAQFSPAHNLFRTDVDGTVSVFVDQNGQINVVTDKI